MKKLDNEFRTWPMHRSTLMVLDEADGLVGVKVQDQTWRRSSYPIRDLTQMQICWGRP